jgi:hypothetical protein
MSTVPRLSRVERWAYNGLHSLDFSFWYNRRPLWDAGMIVLLLGGLASSCFGLAMGIKRVRRGTGRLAAALRPEPSAEATPSRRAAAMTGTES